MVRAAYPLADRVVAVSHGVKADLVSHYGVPPERVETIHNPVDAERLADAAAEAPTIDLPADFFVAAGRLVPARTSRCWCAPSRPPGSRTISSSSAKGRSGRSSKRSRANSGFPGASTFRDMPETRTPSSQGRAPRSRRRTRKAFRTPSSKRWPSAVRSSRRIVQPDPPRFSASRNRPPLRRLPPRAARRPRADERRLGDGRRIPGDVRSRFRCPSRGAASNGCRISASTAASTATKRRSSASFPTESASEREAGRPLAGLDALRERSEAPAADVEGLDEEDALRGEQGQHRPTHDVGGRSETEELDQRRRPDAGVS